MKLTVSEARDEECCSHPVVFAENRVFTHFRDSCRVSGAPMMCMKDLKQNKTQSAGKLREEYQLHEMETSSNASFLKELV